MANSPASRWIPHRIYHRTCEILSGSPPGLSWWDFVRCGCVVLLRSKYQRFPLVRHHRVSVECQNRANGWRPNPIDLIDCLIEYPPSNIRAARTMDGCREAQYKIAIDSRTNSSTLFTVFSRSITRIARPSSSRRNRTHESSTGTKTLVALAAQARRFRVCCRRRGELHFDHGHAGGEGQAAAGCEAAGF